MNKDENKIINENEIEKKEEKDNIIRDKKDIIKNEEKEKQNKKEEEKINEQKNIKLDDKNNNNEILNNKQNELIKPENNHNYKDKENEQNTNKKNDETQKKENKIIKDRIENLQTKQKEQNIYNDSTISKKQKDTTLKDKENQNAENKINNEEKDKEKKKGTIFSMKQNVIDQKINEKKNLDNKENVDENKIIRTEKTELSLSKLQKEKKEEKNEEKGSQKGLSFNKELCKEIASSLPKRTQVDYSTLKNNMKLKTEKLNDKEKSFVLFLWICDNISYDVDSYFAGRNVDCTPEGVYKNGQSVCSGYARLFKDIADFLYLEVQCVSCYAKGVSYRVGKKMNSTNHEYNVIKLNNKWYPIDSTWGAGSVEGKQYKKSFNEFYFLADPELLIKTHFPEKSQWQLTEKKYTLDEFLKWPLIKSRFYIYGFKKCFPNEGLIKLKNSNTQKFIIYGDNMNTKGASCNLYYLEGNIYKQQLNTTKIDFYDDRFEIETIFNKKGKYLVQMFGNNDKGNSYYDISEYSVEVEKDNKQKLSFPKFYSGKEEINVIEPLYDNLKSGQRVKFKVKSNYEEIVVIDGGRGQWLKMVKKENGFYELEIELKAKKNDSVTIAKKTSSSGCSYLVSYHVV